MTMTHKIIYQEKEPEVIKHFFEIPDGLKKNQIYYNNIHQYQYYSESLIEKENSIHYSSAIVIVTKSINGKYFKRYTKKKGFTVTEKGKLNVWFRTPFNEFSNSFVNIFEKLNIDWILVKDLRHFFQFLTPSIFGKILVGKISNPELLAKAVLKNYRIKASHTLFLKFIKHDSFDKYFVSQLIYHSKNFDHAMKFFIEDNVSASIIHDLIFQCKILEEKIDFKWSNKRMSEVHKEFTERLMELELDDIQDKEYPFGKKIKSFFENNSFSEFTHCDTVKSLFKEGKTMSHCVYTNYKQDVEKGECIIFHYDDLKGEVGTLQVKIKYHDDVNTKIFSKGQFYSKYNMKMSDNAHKKADEFINNFETYFYKNWKKETITETADLF